MSHLEARLERDLNLIREQVSKQASQVRNAVKQALHALQTGDKPLAHDVVLEDLPINRAMRAIDAQCHRFIAVHLPSAGHLRLITSVIRVNIELERIGDYAVTIAREALQLSTPPTGTLAQDLSHIAGESLLMLEQSCDAFIEQKAEAAGNTMAIAARLEYHLDKIYQNMMEEQGRPTKDLFALFSVFNQLKRVADQSKNICEDTVFAATGNPKSPKVYRILFLESGDSRYSQMARAIADRNYPNSGRYQSAGTAPAKELDLDLVAFLSEHGMDSSDLTPKSLQKFTDEELASYQILISLEGPVSDYMPAIPFHTSVREWSLETAASGDLEQTYRELSIRIKDLMELLHGEGAD